MNTLRDNAERLVTRLHIEGRKDDADTVSALIRDMQTRDADARHWIAQWNQVRVELEDLKALRRRQIETEEVADTTNTNDIDALMKVLDPNSGKRPTWDNWEVVIFAADAIRHHAALSALVAERDALRRNTTELESELTASAQRVSDLIAEKWRLQDRIKELEAQPPADRDRNMRERLVCAIWPVLIQQWREYKDAIDPRGCARDDALEEADKMLAAMRKGDECNR